VVTVVEAGSVPSSQGVPRLSFGSWAFSFGPFAADPWSFERVARYVAASGYQGIEINGFRPHPHDADYADLRRCAELTDLLGGLGLGVSAFAPDFRSTPPADADLDAFLARIESAATFCERVGTRLLRTDTISPPGPFDPDRFDHLVSAWSAAADRCADHGIRLVWEFEPGFWLNRPSQVRDLLDAVDHPAFGLLFDTSHAYCGAVAGARQGDSPELLEGGVAAYARLVGDRVAHLHLIDSDGSLHDGETSEHVPFGRGHIDFAETLAGLPDAGLGLEWWTVDYCFCPTTEVDGRAAVPFVTALLEQARAEQTAAAPV
jgi:sugar phosphate isomerase/epimerase